MTGPKFLRAYMAGLVPPSIIALLSYIAATVAHTFFNAALPPVEKGIMFPLVVVPNLWGIWNGLWAVSSKRLPLGVHGALMPFLSFGLGAMAAKLLDIPITDQMIRMLPLSLAMSVATYFLIWKYGVRYLNRIAGIN